MVSFVALSVAANEIPQIRYPVIDHKQYVYIYTQMYLCDHLYMMRTVHRNERLIGNDQERDSKPQFQY